MFDYSKLKGKIKEVCDTREEFCKQTGISNTSLYLKLNNKREFTQREMIKICIVLGIEIVNLKEYFFFVNQVHKTEQKKEGERIWKKKIILNMKIF